MTAPLHLLILQSVVGFTLAGAVSALSLWARVLAPSGAVAATVVGGCVFGFGGWQAGVALLAFFFSSTLLGRWRKRRKAGMGFEKGGRRDAGQVLANGGVAALLIVLAALVPAWRSALIVAFFAALAEANADTWATEIGSASGVAPRSIANFRAARPGTSGAVSLPGLLAALLGASLIGATAGLMRFGPSATSVVGVVVLSGFAGSLLDSILGATIQAQYAVGGSDSAESEEPRLTERRIPGSRLASGFACIGNDFVNLLSTLASALLGFVLQHLV